MTWDEIEELACLMLRVWKSPITEEDDKDLIRAVIKEKNK